VRMSVKYVLNTFGLWMRDTWIIGSGKNAQEAYKAINSENNLGLNVVGFISNAEDHKLGMMIDGIQVIQSDTTWIKNIDKRAQFIVAVESHQSDIRNKWLREFMIRGYRYVSVIPTL
ncbi:UDP-phosphate galactose phosphotransferase, partial [Klebsiella pneumoniae]|nr:UDP-phosphate galactose phosphotransferase [Klebsiella pneumoniae]